MTVTFAYTNNRKFEDDIEAALLTGQSVDTMIFELDVADLSPVQSITPIPLKWRLLDGSSHSIKSRSIKKQTLRTKPDLVLNGGLVKRERVDYKTLLERWFTAHSRWIKTDLIKEEKGKNQLAKVLPTADELVFEKRDGTSFLVETTIEFETVT